VRVSNLRSSVILSVYGATFLGKSHESSTDWVGFEDGLNENKFLYVNRQLSVNSSQFDPGEYDDTQLFKSNVL